MALDIVNGIVIGPVTQRFTLVQPSGNRYGNPAFFETEEEGRKWALAEIEKCRTTVGPDESKRLGWDKAWELRID